MTTYNLLLTQRAVREVLSGQLGGNVDGVRRQRWLERGGARGGSGASERDRDGGGGDASGADGGGGGGGGGASGNASGSGGDGGGGGGRAILWECAAMISRVGESCARLRSFTANPNPTPNANPNPSPTPKPNQAARLRSFTATRSSHLTPSCTRPSSRCSPSGGARGRLASCRAPTAASQACNRMSWALQPYDMGAVTACDGACNRM
eukprot:scaffold29533_cov45-Phaeocystis_antarctica.AAC.2